MKKIIIKAFVIITIITSCKPKASHEMLGVYNLNRDALYDSIKTEIEKQPIIFRNMAVKEINRQKGTITISEDSVLISTWLNSKSKYNQYPIIKATANEIILSNNIKIYTKEKGVSISGINEKELYFSKQE